MVKEKLVKVEFEVSRSVGGLGGARCIGHFGLQTCYFSSEEIYKTKKVRIKMSGYKEQQKRLGCRKCA